MNNHKLTCKRVRFFAPYDEDAFFEWIKRIPSIKKFDGRLDELYLYFESNIIPDTDLMNLIGLFYRYKVDMKQLKIFLNKANEKWFYGGYKGYWHKRVFGE